MTGVAVQVFGGMQLHGAFEDKRRRLALLYRDVEQSTGFIHIE
jgi:hypothetical protein